jgi:hypothetical protein
VGRQNEFDAIVDVEDFRVVVHLLGDQCDAAEKPPRLREVAEMIALADRVPVIDRGPAVQFGERRVARGADQLLDHLALRFSSPSPSK